MPTYFAEAKEQENEDIVTINVTGTVRVTHAVLPGMIQRSVTSPLCIFNDLQGSSL